MNTWAETISNDAVSVDGYATSAVRTHIRLRPIAGVTAGPRSEHDRDIAGVGTIGEQMVGAVDRDERLRMSCPVEDLLGILHAHRLVARRVQHQQRAVQSVDALRLRLPGDVVEELPTDGEHAAAQIHLGFPAPLDLLPPA